MTYVITPAKLLNMQFSAAFLACLVCLVPFAIACASSSPTPPVVAIAGAACVSHRLALELQCVDANSTRADIDACRATVRATVDCVDAGAEQ